MKEEELQDDSLIYCEDCCEDVSPDIKEDGKAIIYYCPICLATLLVDDGEDEFY